MVLVMTMNPVPAVVIRTPTVVVSAVIWIAPVIAVIAAWVITVPVCGITESDSDSSDPDGNLCIGLFYRDQSQSDCYQWK